MKTRLLPILFILFGSLMPQNLEAEELALIVLHVDGSSSAFLLSESPEVTFGDSDCVFRSESATVTIERANISDFHFETAVGGIGELKHNETLFRIVGKGIVELINVPASSIKVYDLKGKIVASDISSDCQCTTVSLEKLPEGLYVIRYSDSAIKIKR